MARDAFQFMDGHWEIMSEGAGRVNGQQITRRGPEITTRAGYEPFEG